MAGNRDRPRDIQDAKDYSNPARPMLASNMERFDQEADEENPDLMTPSEALILGRECYESSTNWINSSRRAKWTDSLRAFQGIHPSGSKYLSNDYRYRSRLFRPKTRTMVRTGEASTAAAFFANEDVVKITAQDDNDKAQQASAEVMQRLLQYRLTKTIPWFLTVVGARQDCEVMGACIGKAYWKYGEKYSHTDTRPRMDTNGLPVMDAMGQPLTDDVDVFQKTEDHPWVDLLALENFRFDPGADWRNPIATSPYTIELIPMYIDDVRAKMRPDENGKSEWHNLGDNVLFAATDLADDTTRRAREQGRVPGKDNDAWKPRDFDICWVRENIVRKNGIDQHFLSLSGGGQLLTDPRPLTEVYLQGIRPYVYGIIIPEAHKTYPNAKVELVKDLQTQTNDVANLRLDNVKLALNPRQVLREGSAIDPQDARTFMPGKVLLTRNPREDVVWDRPPDATQGSYAEQDRINLDFDDLTGGFSNSSIQGNRQVYEAVGNMEMMSGNANTIMEYEQRVFAETFVEPLMRQLVKLEQAYETDPVVLGIAGSEAQLVQKFGINQITDDLLRQELTTRVNVGIGATNPEKRLQMFLMATGAVGKIYGPIAAMGSEFDEVTKEIFSLCGYKDGSRFFKPGFDPSQAMAQQAQAKGKGAAPAHDPGPSKVQSAQISAQGKVQEATIRAQSDQRSDTMDLQKVHMQEQAETMREIIRAAQQHFTTTAQNSMASAANPILSRLGGAPNV